MYQGFKNGFSAGVIWGMEFHGGVNNHNKRLTMLIEITEKEIQLKYLYGIYSVMDIFMLVYMVPKYSTSMKKAN